MALDVLVACFLYIFATAVVSAALLIDGQTCGPNLHSCQPVLTLSGRVHSVTKRGVFISFTMRRRLNTLKGCFHDRVARTSQLHAEHGISLKFACQTQLLPVKLMNGYSMK